MLAELPLRAAAALSSHLPTVVDVPNPDARIPKAVKDLADEWIGYLKGGAIIAGVVGMIVCAVMMMIGRRNRSHLATEGLSGIPWVLGGLMLVSMASTVVGTVIR
jgi:type IV secretory pathway VirB2 component (pilin)